MKSPTEINLNVDGFKLQGKRWGAPGKLPLLGLHGWLDNAGSFDYLAPLLQDVDFLALDLPGHGLSSHLSPNEHYRILTLLPVFKKVAEMLEWPQITIIGHSLGSVIGTLLASQEPHLIANLVLIDGIGPLSQELINTPTESLDATMTNIRRSGKNPPKVYTSIDDAITARQKAGNLSEAAARALVLRGLQETDAGYTWRFDPRLLLPTGQYMSEQEVQDMLRKIKAPTVLIEADHGLLLQHPLVLQRMQQFSQLQHVILPGNHHIHLENPRQVAKVINDFLRNSR